MSETLEKYGGNGQISIREIVESCRDKLLRLESAIELFPGAIVGDSPMCPLTHSFGGGIYMRQIFIPKGMVIVGKIHRHDHPNVLVQGDVTVFTEHDGVERIKAPHAMISKAGTKRALVTHEDTTWITFHNVGDERDLKKIEEMIIAPTYEELEEACHS